MENRTKINSLITNWPYSSIYTCSYLNSRGFSYELIKRYRNSGWLRPVGRGAVARVGDEIDWTSGLYAIQTQSSLAIHAGAKTALELQAAGHFIPLGKGQLVFLFGAPATKLPAWFKNYRWGVSVNYTTTDIFPRAANSAMEDFKVGKYSIRISSRERAIMEVLHLIPQSQDYEEAKLLMEGLRTLRPKLVQSLLEQCGSVKVKRLFMHLAESCNQPWVRKLDLKKVDFGAGKRVIGGGGNFNSRYSISVPKSHSNEGLES
jgi:hypothetical protein